MQSPLPLFETGIAIPALALTPHWRLRIDGPLEDLDQIFDELIKIYEFPYGKTDRNASVSAPGFEYYRPLADTPTGAEANTRKRPDVMEMRLTIPPDASLLKQLLEIVYQFHSYYEPPVSVEAILRSSTRGLDDTDNPHRWWNKDGDWKKD